MTLDGFLPEPDDVLTQWVMNHRKGFVHWREHCNAWILPHSILDLLCEKDRKNASFTYLAEVHDAESLELLPGTLPLQPCGRIHCLSVSLFHRKGEFRTGYSSFSAMAVA